MTDRELRRALLDVPAPDEEATRERAWTTVRAAFQEREPVSWPVRHARPLIAFAVVGAVLASALTPPGRAVVDEVRDAIGRQRTVGVQRAEPELFSLPARGRALVESRRGLWLVRADGSRRLLGRYRDAAWSPHGLFIAAVRGNQLTAFDERGKLRWSVPRRGFLAAPSWTGTRTDTRIAYLAGSVPQRELRVVAGDGTDDRLIARRVAPVAPAWRPGPERELSYALRSGRLVVADADTGAVRWRARAGPTAKLAWSGDGKRLLVADGRQLRVFGAGGRLMSDFAAPRGFFVVDGAFAPSGRVAYLAVSPARNESRIFVTSEARPRQLFAGPGWFTALRWSPDGGRLAFTWPEADQLVFLSVPRKGRIRAVANASRHFGRIPRITDWCCAPGQ